MTDTLDAPVLVLVDLDQGEGGAPGGPVSAPGLELVTAARSLTDGDVVALALEPPSAAAAQALAGAGTTRLLVAEWAEGTRAAADAGSGGLPALSADAVVAAVRAVSPALVLVVSDYRGKEAAGRAAVLLGSAAVSDATGLEVVDGGLRVSKLVLSGSWSTTVRPALPAAPDQGGVPVIALRPGSVEPASAGGAAGASAPAAEPLEVAPRPESTAVRRISCQALAATTGPALSEARTVVVGGRGVDGDFALVRSLADPLEAAVGATRVACDEGWAPRSAQVGQTGESISPRLYIGLGVSGAVHHTSGIQGAGAIVAVCDDSEAPIFEMADFGVVGDVSEVVPQLVEELARLRG